MRKILLTALALAGLGASASVIVETPAYRWEGDTVFQGEFKAYPLSAKDIESTYSAQPGFRMPVEKRWSLRNDISAYPRLVTPNLLHEATYNMALDEMVNAVEPDTTLRTGKEWAGVWTRDVSYSILLSMAYMQPEAARISLEKKVDSLGRIIQDTGSGGAWPISTDRQIWSIAAWEVYKVTGDKDWLRWVYPIVKRSLETDAEEVMAPTGLVKGETSFIDWREQSHPKWMQTADIFNTETLSTSIVHAQAWHVLSEMASELGHEEEARYAEGRSKGIMLSVNALLWDEERGYYDMYRYGRANLINDPRAEALGESLAIMWDVADPGRAKAITQNMPLTPWGVPVFTPQIADMPSYHNNALWPWVAAWWGMANAKAGNEKGVMQAIGSVIRPAALFATNKENLNLDNGDIATELNSSNMLWCLAGNIALTHRILFGIDYRKDGLYFKPFVPEALGQKRSLENFPYRKAMLDITVNGYGDRIASFKVNGKESPRHFIPTTAKGKIKIDIQMADTPIEPLDINLLPAAEKMPLTPFVRIEGERLKWQPIEYAGGYLIVRDGKIADKVHTTTYPTEPGHEYQVIALSGNGHVRSMASEPVNTFPLTVIDLGKDTTISSPELVYAPIQGTVDGYSGEGFVTLDKQSPVLNVPVFIPDGQEGRYMLTATYANGNGPVNTENRAGIRTLLLDGGKVGTLVLPQRGVGNWSDWGDSNPVILALSPGHHILSIAFLPGNENMNIEANLALIDALRLYRLPDTE